MRLSAHFGQWLTLCRRGRNVRQWQVAEGLIYGQVKKSYRWRTLVRVTPVMRLGTEEALKAALEGLGLSGRLNTAFIERANLTVRHGVAALARRTWATAQQSPHLLAHLEWWRAYYHFVRPQALPWDMVDNWISLCNPFSGSFLHHGTVQAGHLLLQEGFIHRLLLARSSTSLREATATASDLRVSQAGTCGKGNESTSRAVHRRLVLPAAIAGVRCR
jgi:hypothetical protein